MRCPACHSDQHYVLKTRDGVRRTRQCKACPQQFHTHEGLDTANLFVRKRAGGNQAFSRRRLAESIEKAAVNKLPASEVADLVEQVVEELFAHEPLYVDAASDDSSDLSGQSGYVSTYDVGVAVMRVLDKSPVYRATRMRYGLLFERSNRSFVDAKSFLEWLVTKENCSEMSLPPQPARVVKRKGSAEDFSPQQLYNSIKFAVRKRPVEEDREPGAKDSNAELISTLYRLILERVRGQRTVTTAQLSLATTWVLLSSKDQQLASLISRGDRELAYLRVISSAKRFTKVEDFQAEALLLVDRSVAAVPSGLETDSKPKPIRRASPSKRAGQPRKSSSKAQRA